MIGEEALLISFFRTAILLILMTFICVTAFDFLSNIRALKRVETLFSPLMSVSKLPKELSPVILMGIFNHNAMHVTLSSLRKSGEIEDNDVITFSLVSSPVHMISILFKFYIPVVMAALGPLLGGVYTAFLVLTSLVGMTLGILYGKWKLRTKQALVKIDEFHSKRTGFIFKNSLKRALSTIGYIMKRYIVVILIFLVLIKIGLFDWLSSIAEIALGSIALPPQSLVIASTYTINPIAGLLTAGEMFKGGLIGAREVLLALVIGKFFFILIFDFPKHSFPFYASMYPIRLATKLTLTLIFLTTLTTPLLLALVFLIFPG